MRRVRHIERIANLRHLAEAVGVTLQARNEMAIPHRRAKSRDRHVATSNIVGAKLKIFGHGLSGENPIVALSDGFHASHSTFRSRSCQACDSSVVDKWGINFPPPLPSQLLLSSAPYCSERSSSWFRVAVSVSSRSRILSRRRWTRASFASTLRCSFSIIVRRSFSRSCAGVRITRLPRGPPLRVLEAVLVVPLVRVLLMRSLYQVRRRKGTH